MRCGAGWTGKYCLGLELDDEGSDFTVLSEFRARLVAGAMEAALLEALLGRLGELGLVGAGMRQRTDSTRVLGRIRDLNRPGAGRGDRAGGAGGAGGRGAGLAGAGDRRVLAGGPAGSGSTGSGCRTARPGARTWPCGTAGTATCCCGG